MFHSYFPQRNRSFPHLKSVVTGNGWSLSAQYELLSTDSVIKKIIKWLTAMGNSSQFLTHKKHLTFPAAVWTSDFAAALCASCANGTTAKSLRDCFAGHCIKKKRKKKCIAGHACALDPEKYIHHILIRNKKERERGIANWNVEEKRRGHRQSTWARMFNFFNLFFA